MTDPLPDIRIRLQDWGQRVINARDAEFKSDKTQHDTWSNEFDEELFHEIDLIREEGADNDDAEIKADVSVKVEPSLVQSSIKARKMARLFNRTARMIITTTRSRKFETAEYLRTQLFKINPKASSEIYKIGQFIEREKRKISTSAKTGLKDRKCTKVKTEQRVTNGKEKQKLIPEQKKTGKQKKSVVKVQGSQPVEIEFMGCWFDLYLNMTGHECSVFRNILKKEEFSSSHRIIEQQQINNRLYFINQGAATIFETYKGIKTVIKELKAGDIAGSGSFFNRQKSDNTVAVEPGTEVEFIEKDDLKLLKAKCPELIGKLQIYCQLKK